MCAVVLKVAEGQKRFIAMCCINIVVAANAGGAFTPFGDITTLMVWQAGKVQFIEFFDPFLPAVVNFAVPAIIMTFFIPKGKPASITEKVELKRGARRVMMLFLTDDCDGCVWSPVPRFTACIWHDGGSGLPTTSSATSFV